MNEFTIEHLQRVKDRIGWYEWHKDDPQQDIVFLSKQLMELIEIIEKDVIKNLKSGDINYD